MARKPAQKAEMLNEVQIAEIWEIFTLFDKDSDGYVDTVHLGTMIRGLGYNPSQKEVKEMEKDVDPSGAGSFDKNSLISLVARRPKKEVTLQQMIDALTTLSDPAEQEGNALRKFQEDNFCQ